MATAVALLSGGLDSTLAAWIIRRQGVEVYGLTGSSVFHPGFHGPCRHPAAETAAEFLDIPLKVIDITEPMLAMVKNPAHGLGAHLNPCVDCRSFLLRQARQYLDELGGDFIVTGEVLGQRPMSQRRGPMNIVEREARVEGILVRPLCAKHLPKTTPEKQGLIDREKLCDFTGRSRKPQMRLAQEIGLADYPSPAGGCLLTDPGFSARMTEAMEYDDLSSDDIELLKVGRHFRLADGTKVVVGRSEIDNKHLAAMARKGDLLVELDGLTGPLTLLRGTASEDNTALAGALTARFSKARDRSSADVEVRPVGGENRKMNISPAIAEGLVMIQA